MNVQFESGSDLEESDISDEKKDPLNDTNSNANQDIAALNAQNTFAGNLENANLRVNTMQTQLPAFERDPNGLLTP